MTHKLKLQLAGMVEEGMTYQNSLAVRELVDSSLVMQDFYDSLMLTSQKLKSFFQSKAVKKTNAKLVQFIDQTLEPKKSISSRLISLPLCLSTTISALSLSPLL